MTERWSWHSIVEYKRERLVQLFSSFFFTLSPFHKNLPRSTHIHTQYKNTMSLSKSSSMPATPATKNNISNKTVASPRSSMQTARPTGQWTLTSDQAFESTTDNSSVPFVLLPYLPLL